MKKSLEFEENIKGKKTNLILGIIFIAIAFVLLLCNYLNFIKIKPTNLIDATKENEYVSISVESMSKYFATSGDNSSSSSQEKMYFIADHNYIYLANIDNKTLKELQKILDYSYSSFENAVAPDPVTLYGKTKLITDEELKKIAINSYNKIFNVDYLNSENFENYLGIYYIDTHENPKKDLESVIIGSVFLVFMGVIFLFIYRKTSKNTKESLSIFTSKMDLIKREIDNDSTYYKKAKLYLTTNYLISYYNGLEIIPYNEIVWVYASETKKYGMLVNKSLMVITKDKKAHNLSSISASKKNLANFDEIYQLLKLKTNDVLFGYTAENIKKIKKMYKK